MVTAQFTSTFVWTNSNDDWEALELKSKEKYLALNVSLSYSQTQKLRYIQWSQWGLDVLLKKMKTHKSQNIVVTMTQVSSY